MESSPQSIELTGDLLYKKAEELFSNTFQNSIKLSQNNSELVINLGNIEKEDYVNQFFVDVFEMGIVLKRELRRFSIDASCVKHEKEDVFFFNLNNNREAWLKAKIYYENNTCLIYLEKVQLVAFKRLINNILDYYNITHGFDDVGHGNTIVSELIEEMVLKALEEKEYAFSKRVSDASKTSTESIFNIGSGRLSELFVDVTVDRVNKIKVNIGPGRPKTQYGSKQESHITAYGLLIESIIKKINYISIKDIQDIFFITFSLFNFQKTEVGNLEKLICSYKDELNDRRELSREKYKKTIGKLSSYNELSYEDEIKDVKSWYRGSKALFLQRFLKDVITEVLVILNRRSSATFRALHKKTRSELGKEGSKIRIALSSLRFLDSLMKEEKIELRKANPVSKKEEKNSEIQSFNAFQDQKSLEFIDSLLAPRENNSLLFSGDKKNQLKVPEELIKEIACFCEHCLDFNYHEQLAIQLVTSFQRDVHTLLPEESAVLMDEEIISIFSSLEDKEIIRFFKEGGAPSFLNNSFKDLFEDSRKDIYSLSEKNISILFKDILIVHCVVFFESFPGIVKLLQKNLSSFFNFYLDENLNKQGWGGAVEKAEVSQELSLLFEGNQIKNFLGSK